MGEQKLEFSCMSEDPNVATFEAKIKEKIYELQIKRVRKYFVYCKLKTL